VCVFRTDEIADDADWHALGLQLKHFAAMMRRYSKPVGRERELIGLAGAPPVAARSSFAAPAAKAAIDRF
jgi:hypothetical protein